MYSVDKFGRWYLLDTELLDEPAGERGNGLLLDPNFDDTYLMPENKRIYHIEDPIDDEDSITFAYMRDNVINRFIDYKYDALNSTITNVGNPYNQSDVVNRQYIDRLYPQEVGSTLHMKDRVLGEIADPEDNTDIANYHFLTSTLQTVREEYQDVYKILTS